MKNQKIMYILISLFCVFAVIAGIYAQFIDANRGGLNISNNDKEVVEQKSQTVLKDNFNALFTNTLNLNGYDTTGIQKINTNQDIVYSVYEKKEATTAYEVDIHIPVINIKNELSNTFNQITQAIFINKANEVLKKTEAETKTIYSIDYTAYINSNILSLVIKSTLKEGSSAQRIIVQTYNYNLETNTEAKLVDLMNVKKINKDEVNSKIKEVVNSANQESETLKNMGYNQIYSRDLTSEIYNADNAGTYFLGPNQELYILYAYGNGEFTSEMDIVLFE